MSLHTQKQSCSEAGSQELIVALFLIVLIGAIAEASVLMGASQLRRETVVIDRLQAFYQAELAGRAQLFKTLGSDLKGGN